MPVPDPPTSKLPSPTTTAPAGQAVDRDLSPQARDQARQMRRIGRLAFWAQLAVVFIACLCAIFAVTGRQFSNEEFNPVIGWGIFFAVSGILAGCAGIYFSWRYNRIGRRLLVPTSKPNPKKSNAVQLLKLGLYVGIGGTLVALFGCGLTGSILLAKTISQPPGTTLTDASEAVRALDVLVMLANLNCVVTHWFGTVSVLWLLYQLRYPELLEL